MSEIGDHNVAFIDLGTNSARLLLVAIKPNHSYAILSQQREVVRLGQNEFERHELEPDAIERAAAVCAKFAAMARANHARQIIAVATSAAREARNQNTLLSRVREEAGINLRVVPGLEEARLVFLGVVSGLRLDGRKALVIDIGGGSTEIIVGGRGGFDDLDSLPLGAIRLTDRFLGSEATKPVSDKVYQTMMQHVRDTGIRTLQRFSRYSPDLAVGSSGTIVNLLEMASLMHLGRPKEADDEFSLDQIRAVTRQLRSRDLEGRLKIPGINPNRADIIVGGACIIEALMEDLEIRRLRSSDRTLRDGMLVEYLAQLEPNADSYHESPRERSALALGRACNFDEAHARRTATLSLQLFDSARKAGLISLGEAERELLYFGSLLHDVGIFLSYERHERHGHYFILNAKLLGFSQREIGVLACLARYHRKANPKKDHSEFASLEPESQKVVPELAMMLSLAESLDRSHADIVERAHFLLPDPGSRKSPVELHIEAKRNCDFELWGLSRHDRYFRRIFGRPLVPVVDRVGAGSVPSPEPIGRTGDAS